jgi:hypothetical protein
MYRCSCVTNTTQDRGARCAAALSVVRVAIGAILAVCSAASAAAEIEIGQGDCGAGVHLVARGAPLSDVLSRLAATLGFELQLIGASDSLIDVDLSRPAPELVAKLSPRDNIIVLQSRDPSCPGRLRIVKVWMLGKGNPSASRANAPLPVTRQMSEAEKQQNREADEMYRKAHGIPPPGRD